VNDEEKQFVDELLAGLPGELRETFEEAARLDGLTLEEYVLVLLQDMDRGGLLDAATDSDISEDEFLRLVFVGDCPNCSSESTVCCDEIKEIDDPTVGLCKDCGYMWCLECGIMLEMNETCGHWDICESCDEPKNEFEDCGIMPSECPRIVEWISGNYAHPMQDSCAWCGKEIPENSEVYAVGATLKGGIEFRTEEGSQGFFMPVSIAGRMIPAIVTAPGSDARRQGNDLMFMTCSEQCAGKLRETLSEEKELIDRAELN
jgi:hypothetical protein